jgi:hypothetical protein
MGNGFGIEYMKPKIEEYGSLEELTTASGEVGDDGLTGSN